MFLSHQGFCLSPSGKDFKKEAQEGWQSQILQFLQEDKAQAAIEWKHHRKKDLLYFGYLETFLEILILKDVIIKMSLVGEY